MKIAFFLLLITLFFFGKSCVCQTYQGRVLDESTSHALAYVNIGILNSNYGTTTDENGNYKLFLKNVNDETLVRFSMIGYKPQIHSLKDLEKESIVKLLVDNIQLQEVTIHSPKLREDKVGTKASSNKIVTGWGNFGKGGERGLKIDLKDQSSQIMDVNFYIAQNLFDSVLLRLHVRKITDRTPSQELLNQNVFIKVRIKNGWVKFELTDYNLIFRNEIAITLEWVKAWGVCKDGNCLLFSLNAIKGTLYAKEASESTWTVKSSKSPGIYLTVLN